MKTRVIHASIKRFEIVQKQAATPRHPINYQRCGENHNKKQLHIEINMRVFHMRMVEE